MNSAEENNNNYKQFRKHTQCGRVKGMSFSLEKGRPGRDMIATTQHKTH